MSTPLLKMVSMEKKFKQTVALGGVDLEVRKGEVHILLGENGAGKSTLMKILAGSHQPDSGTIYWDGKEVKITNPSFSINLGINMVYQELTLVKEMSVTENIFLGQLKKRRGTPLVSWNENEEMAKDLLNRLGLGQVNPRSMLKDYKLGTQQLIEIARAISRKSKLIILDEPTSALTEQEVEKLFKSIRVLKEQGVSFIYITHKLNEVFEIGDRVTVLRDGVAVGTKDSLKGLNEDELIKMMVGRSLKEQFPKVPAQTDNLLLRVKNLCDKQHVKDVSFDLHKGEILGIAGLEGSFRTEMVEILFGLNKLESGEIELYGEKFAPKSPLSAIKNKIAYLTKDRKNSLLIHMPIFQNITVSSPGKFSRYGFRHKKEEIEVAGQFLTKLRVNTDDPQKVVGQLSGGNQQKIAIARWLCSKSQIFIMDEPTRGIDVGAKVEVYKQMNEIVREGAGIILISSEMPELLGMSDRILVMREGKLVGNFERDNSSQEKIMHLIAGGV